MIGIMIKMLETSQGQEKLRAVNEKGNPYSKIKKSKFLITWCNLSHLYMSSAFFCSHLAVMHLGKIFLVCIMTRRDKCALCQRCLNIMKMTDVDMNVTKSFIFQSTLQKYPKFSTNGKIALSSTKNLDSQKLQVWRDLGEQ